ncbi:MAG TPA: glycine zipper 2TM domain-containing protein [Gallionella sp.]|nr:glycine zipper 2TM domain-containing protein [Gallionella sp.]
MKKTVLLLSLASLYTGANAEDFTDTARVVSSTPIYERVNQPRRECWNETVQGSAAPSERSYGGAIVGGIAGGVIGSQVGGGNGRLAATAAGTLAGAMIGDRVANQGQQQPTSHQVERCRQVDNTREVITGYTVTYRYNGRQATTTLPYDPGSTIKVSVSAIEDRGAVDNRRSDDRRYDDRRY